VRARVLKILAGAGIFLLALLCLYLVFPSGEVRTVLLTDGTTLKIAHISYGKEHRYLPGPAWRRMVAKAPANIAGIFGVIPRIDRYPEDTMVVWLEWNNSPGRQLFPQRLRVLDSNGLASAYIIDRHVQLSNRTAVVAFRLTSFPRRQRFLDFEWFGSNSTESTVQEEHALFRVRNEWLAANATSPQPQWPTSAEFDGEQFTLCGINSGLYATGALAAQSLSNQWTEFVFQVGTNGPDQRTTNALDQGAWIFKSLELRDAFGNVVQDQSPQGYGTRWDNGIGVIPGAIWPDQIWNVRAEFERTSRLPNPRHTWTTTVPVPAAGVILSLRQTGQLEVCTIELKSIERGGGLMPPPELTVLWQENSRDLPKPLVTGSYQVSLVHAEDQIGSNVVSWVLGGGNGLTHYQLRVAPEAKELKLTFVVQHSIMVELSGRASILRTNVARWGR
jgi:hypothetical protein